MFHTVYLSYETSKIGRGYVGKHSTDNPYDTYLGSFKDKSFNPSSKLILEYCNTEEGAVLAEMRWQRVLNVVEDPEFANKAYQTSSKFLYDNTGNTASEGTKIKISESKLGEKNPFYGKTHTPEIQASITESTRERWKNEEYRKKLVEIHKNRENSYFIGVTKGMKWWYNPVTTERMRSIESPGPEWVNQRGEDSRVGKKHWVNKEGDHKFQPESPGPGWINARKWA